MTEAFASTRIPLSVLELAPVSAGSDAAAALGDATELAVRADRCGYARFWVAEHHGSDTFMASATAVILAHLANHTRRIRLGSGGVMLPNHAPLMVAEYYGTLATLYGDRIDLGLGRAPGTDPVTASALRRGTGELDTFAQDATWLVALLGDPDSGPFAGKLPVRALPGEGTGVPLWMLGSSLGGASVAAHLGLPFAFASHFAPKELVNALAYYREHFDATAATAQVDRPTVMAGVNVVCAPTDEEADLLATTARALTESIRLGRRGPLQPPDPAALRNIGGPIEPLLGIDGLPVPRAIGTPERVVCQLEAFAAAHQLDEMIVSTYLWSPVLRRRSYELLAGAWGLPGR
jgi:luciferase family oxidoreductase group 1